MWPQAGFEALNYTRTIRDPGSEEVATPALKKGATPARFPSGGPCNTESVSKVAAIYNRFCTFGGAGAHSIDKRMMLNDYYFQ